MASYEPFSDEMLTNIGVWWMANHVSSIQITIGPLSVVWQLDIFNSFIRIYTHDSGEVDAGSEQWYGSEYVVFRCVYWFVRHLGLRCWEWEIQNALTNSINSCMMKQCAHVIHIFVCNTHTKYKILSTLKISGPRHT